LISFGLLARGAGVPSGRSFEYPWFDRFPEGFFALGSSLTNWFWHHQSDEIFSDKDSVSKAFRFDKQRFGCLV
jgi:hypothetical protein